MLLVVYVAVGLALLLDALRTSGPERPKNVFTVVMFMPGLMAGLSAMILRPGPSRDLVAAFFVTSQFMFVGLFFTTGTLGWLMIMVEGRSLPGRPSGFWADLATLAFFLSICLPL